LLPNGQVLVVAGLADVALASVELFDPASGTWTAASALNIAREGISVAPAITSAHGPTWPAVEISSAFSL
jgi:hypothetical protein